MEEGIPFFLAASTEQEMEQKFSNITCHHKSFNISEVEFFRKDQFGLTNNLHIGYHVSMYYWFRLTYYTTFLGCIFGIVRFLDLGPTRILSTSFWTNIFGYLLAIFSVAQSLHTKALGLGTGGVIVELILKQTGLCEDAKGEDHHGHHHSGIDCINHREVHKTMRNIY